MNTQKRPLVLLVVLSLCLLFLGYSGFIGGYEMLTNPNAPWDMPLSYLERTLFSDFTIPGLLLIVIWGLGSLVTLLGLWLRPQWSLIDEALRWTHEQWVWALPLLLGTGLLIWLTYQIFTLPAIAPIQFMLYGLAALLVVLPLLPAMRRYYRS